MGWVCWQRNRFGFVVFPLLWAGLVRGVSDGVTAVGVTPALLGAGTVAIAQLSPFLTFSSSIPPSQSSSLSMHDFEAQGTYLWGSPLNWFFPLASEA